jgi:RNA 2',3'-cyclic 3'-phosphodiesterase
MRLFVGIALPETVRDRIALLEGGIPGARWVKRDNLHVTLRFIGEVDGGAAHDIDAALAAVKGRGFPMAFSGLGCFDRRGRVHTLWVAIEKSDALMRLQAKIESALVRAELEPERRKFHPHAAIARMKNGVKPGHKIGAYLEANNRFAAGPFDVDRFVLFESHLGRDGPHYETLAEYPLDR